MVPRSGIVAFGAALPRSRISRETIASAMSWANPAFARQKKGARAICNWDEDAITLAVAAARSCLEHAHARGMDTSDIRALYLASTTLPFADRDCATLVAAALDFPRELETLTIGTSLRAGTSALLAGLQREGPGFTLVIAADARHAQPGSAQELSYGHGAAAFLVGASEAPCAHLAGRASTVANFVDHYREADADFDYTLEERWVRDEGYFKLVPEALVSAIQRSGFDATRVTRIVMPGASAVVRKVADRAKLDQASAQDSLAADCGDTGAAHALLMLAAALEHTAPDEAIALVGFGQGVDAAIFVAIADSVSAGEGWKPVTHALARRAMEPNYLRYLSHAGAVQVDFGMRAERDNRSAHSTAWRKARQVDGFVGGRCKRCGTVQFPKFRVCVNPDCRATDTLEDFALANSSGRVKTFTEDWQAYSARPPYVYGNVEFEGGGNLLMEFTDVDAGELAVGDRVRFVFRVKDIDTLRGFRRYFWKAIKA